MGRPIFFSAAAATHALFSIAVSVVQARLERRANRGVD
jgi:hypothetical protein